MSSSIHNLDTLREAAITLMREVESLASQQEPQPARLGLQEEVQRYETEELGQRDQPGISLPAKQHRRDDNEEHDGPVTHDS